MKKLLILTLAAVLVAGMLPVLSGCKCTRRGARSSSYRQSPPPPPPPRQEPITEQNADRVETFEGEKEIGRRQEGVIESDR